MLDCNLIKHFQLVGVRYYFITNFPFQIIVCYMVYTATHYKNFKRLKRFVMYYMLRTEMCENCSGVANYKEMLITWRTSSWNWEGCLSRQFHCFSLQLYLTMSTMYSTILLKIRSAKWELLYANYFGSVNYVYTLKRVDDTVWRDTMRFVNNYFWVLQ